jgi:hypothetical protein
MDHVQFKRANYKPKVNSTCNVENPVPGASSLTDVSLQRTSDEVPGIFRAVTDGLISRRFLNSPDRK